MQMEKAYDHTRFSACQFTSTRNIWGILNFHGANTGGCYISSASGVFSAGNQQSNYRSGDSQSGAISYASVAFNASTYISTGPENKPYSILAVPIYVY